MKIRFLGLAGQLGVAHLRVCPAFMFFISFFISPCSFLLKKCFFILLFLFSNIFLCQLQFRVFHFSMFSSMVCAPWRCGVCAENMIQLPGVGWKLLACQNGASPDWIIVVVVEWLYYSKRIIMVRWADLSDFFRSFSSVKCVFLFHVQ